MLDSRFFRRSNMLRMILELGGAGGSAHEAYKNTVLGVQSANLIAYWPLDELSGTNADNAEGTAARDGTFSGVTLDSADGPFTGGRAGSWDGTNDYCDIYSASLDSAFNGQEGSFSAWCKVSGSGVWTDNTYRAVFYLTSNASNRIRVVKGSTAESNEMTYWYTAGGTNEKIQHATTTTGWFHTVITWSLSNDRVRAYFNGSQTGVDSTGLGTYTLALDSTLCNVGAQSNAGALSWSGYLAHAAVWSTELTAADVTTLYNGGPS